MSDTAVTDPGAKLQRERLQDEFTKALDNFQRVQREAAEREREQLAAAKQTGQQWELAGPGDLEQGGQGQARTQLMVEEEERLGQLQQREQVVDFYNLDPALDHPDVQGMRQLESDIVDVNTIFKVTTSSSLH